MTETTKLPEPEALRQDSLCDVQAGATPKLMEAVCNGTVFPSASHRPVSGSASKRG